MVVLARRWPFDFRRFDGVIIRRRIVFSSHFPFPLSLQCVGTGTHAAILSTGQAGFQQQSAAWRQAKCRDHFESEINQATTQAIKGALRNEYDQLFASHNVTRYEDTPRICRVIAPA